VDRSDLQRAIAAHPFAQGLSEEHVRLLADCAMQTHFDKDQVIFRQGETANRFYLIESGEVVLESVETPERSAMVEVIGAGDLLGWSWLFPPYVWQFTARAGAPTSAIFLYATVLREYLEKDPALGYELFKRMSEVMTRRLQAARTRLLESHKMDKARAAGAER
jgi:CRP-like cAMP-binding protein